MPIGPDPAGERTRVGEQKPFYRAKDVESANAEGDSGEIPIFCAGGCGEVVGYFSQRDELRAGKASEYVNWCPACQAADLARKNVAMPKAPATSTDELAELREPTRNLGWLRLLQVIFVALIIAGSIFIALGDATGIYLTVFGTLGWLASGLALRKRTNRVSKICM